MLVVELVQSLVVLKTPGVAVLQLLSFVVAGASPLLVFHEETPLSFRVAAVIAAGLA